MERPSLAVCRRVLPQNEGRPKSSGTRLLLYAAKLRVPSSAGLSEAQRHPVALRAQPDFRQASARAFGAGGATSQTTQPSKSEASRSERILRPAYDRWRGPQRGRLPRRKHDAILPDLAPPTDKPSDFAENLQPGDLVRCERDGRPEGLDGPLFPVSEESRTRRGAEILRFAQDDKRVSRSCLHDSILALHAPCMPGTVAKRLRGAIANAGAEAPGHANVTQILGRRSGATTAGHGPHAHVAREAARPPRNTYRERRVHASGGRAASTAVRAVRDCQAPFHGPALGEPPGEAGGACGSFRGTALVIGRLTLTARMPAGGSCPWTRRSSVARSSIKSPGKRCGSGALWRQMSSNLSSAVTLSRTRIATRVGGVT